MKVKNLFITLGLAMAAALGAGLGLGLKGEAKEAKADATTTLYFDCTSITDWATNAQVYFRTSNANYYACTKVNGLDGLWSYSIDLSTLPYGGFTFRNSNSGYDDENEISWVSSSSIVNGKQIIVGRNSKNTGDHNRREYYLGTLDSDATSMTGYASKLNPTNLTQRIWISTADGSVSGYWGIPSLRVGNGSTADYYATTNAATNLYYADIPFNASYINIIRRAGLFNSFYTISPDVKDFSGLNGTVCYLKDSSGSISVDLGDYTGDAVLFGKVLEPFLVCDSNSRNGYGAASTLYTNFYSVLSNEEKANLATTFINDYAIGSYSGNSDSYDDLPRTTSTSVQAKWEAICEAARISPTTGASLSRLTIQSAAGESSSSLIIVTITAISLIALGGFFFIRRRKEDR